MYFDKFPIIYYDYDINGEQVVQLVRDITINVRIRKNILDLISIYDEYDIKEDETPEIISEKVYGSPIYHWVIMLCNERYDYVDDFPLSTRDFEKYVRDKYGDNVAGIHHYENEQGYVVNADAVGASPITNYNYEMGINESKRRIKLISSKNLFKILAQFRTLV